jgi:hypothetical protein
MNFLAIRELLRNCRNLFLDIMLCSKHFCVSKRRSTFELRREIKGKVSEKYKKMSAYDKLKANVGMYI